MASSFEGWREAIAYLIDDELHNVEETMTETDDGSPSLDELAAIITTKVDGSRETFMLLEPLSLTIKKKNGDYSKRPHVGGEEFGLVRAYAGKRRKMIFVFKPLAATDYVEMELDELAAKRSMSGFESWLRNAFGAELDRNKREAQEKASLAAERERLAVRETEYADMGFGSW